MNYIILQLVHIHNCSFQSLYRRIHFATVLYTFGRTWSRQLNYRRSVRSTWRPSRRISFMGVCCKARYQLPQLSHLIKTNLVWGGGGGSNWQVSTVGWHLLFRSATRYRLHPRHLLHYSRLSLSNYKCITNLPKTDGAPKLCAPARSHLAKLTIKEHSGLLPTGTPLAVSLSQVQLRHTSCKTPANLTVDMFCPDSCCWTP